MRNVNSNEYNKQTQVLTDGLGDKHEITRTLFI